MIQRIQSLYLLVVALLFTLLLCEPALGSIACQCNKVASLSSILYADFLFALKIIITAVAVITIFLYKKRSHQIKLIILNMLLMAAYCIPIVTYLLPESFLNFLIPALIPIITIILNYLALRAIAKDEKLVRSLDRLR